jgi:hypothetical protein
MQNSTIHTAADVLHRFVTLQPSLPITSTAQPSFTLGQRLVTFCKLMIIISVGTLPLLYIPETSYFFHFLLTRQRLFKNTVGQDQDQEFCGNEKTALKGTLHLICLHSVCMGHFLGLEGMILAGK